MGLNHKEILKSSPKILRTYDLAHEEKIKEQDFFNWTLGKYFAEAISATVGNMFNKKGQKEHEYPKKPYLSEQNDSSNANMSEEEKKRKTELFFARLQAMQTNFELNQIDKAKDKIGD